MYLEDHCFGDSDTEHDYEIRSKSLCCEEPAEDAEGAWAHPYEDMELIQPPAKVELREFPVIDIAREAEAADQRHRKLVGLNGLASGGDGASRATPGIVRSMGKGSWTIRVAPSGGMGKVVHKENPGPERRAILPCVHKDGAGNVLVGSLGDNGWAFTDVARQDKRAMSLLWPKEKCVGNAMKAKAKLPDCDISEMTPEERLLRERRDEKNRKERERRAHIKLEKQRLKAEEEMAAAAAAAAAAATATGAVPATGVVSGAGPSAPVTPAPGTPIEGCEVGTPNTVSRADVSKAEFPSVPAHVRPHAAAGKTVPASAPTVVVAATHPPSTNKVPTAIATASTLVTAATSAHSTTQQHATTLAVAPTVPAMAAPVKSTATVPAALPAAATTNTVATNAALMGKQGAAVQLPAQPSASTVATPTSVKIAGMPSASPLSPGRNATTTTAARKDTDDSMQEDAAEKENLEDEEKGKVQSKERGRGSTRAGDGEDNSALAKRRRIASLSPVEVNCRTGPGETKRSVRPRGVQRA